MDVIDEYVARLGSRLHGPRRVRADMLTEARDSLADAAEAFEAGGLDRVAAQHCAVREFGPIEVIAPDFQTELSISQGRRTALLTLLVLAPQPVLWNIALTGGEQYVSGGPLYDAAADAVEWLGGVAIIGALVAVLACGIGVRWLPDRARLARVTGGFAMTAAVVLSALGIVLTAFNPAPVLVPLFDHRGVAWLVLVLLMPLALVGVSARRCLRTA